MPKFAPLGFCLLLGIHASARATSIVILANSTEIVVVADSKSIAPLDGHVGAPVCKLFKIDTMYWAMSGYTDNPSTGYSVAAIVRASYTPGQGVEKTLDVFTKAVTKPLMRALTSVPSSVLGVIRYHPLEIAFWSFENGKPVIATISYTTTLVGGTLTLQPYAKRIIRIAMGNDSEGIGLGVAQRLLSSYADAHRDWKDNLNDTAQEVITASIKDAPTEVGPPISDLIVYSDGTEYWATRRDCCHGRLHEGPPPPPLHAEHKHWGQRQQESNSSGSNV